MLELIEKAEEIGWGMIVLVIAITILLVPVAVESWNKFLDERGVVCDADDRGLRRDGK